MADINQKKLSTNNTKQQLLDAYNELLTEIEKKKGQELKPAEIIKEKETKKTLEEATKISENGINKIIQELKNEFARTLSNLETQLETSNSKYESLKKAVEIKQAEINEIYGIDHQANSLAALIETYNRKKEEFDTLLSNEREDFEDDINTKKTAFDAEMKQKREAFQLEMNSKKESWEIEKKNYAQEIKERDIDEQKKRQRDKEDFIYNFEKEKRTLLDGLNNQKSHLEKEIADMKEKNEKEFTERESKLKSSEKELNELRAKAAAYEKDLANAVMKAVTAATEKINIEAKHREEILIKEIEGERKLFSAQIAGLEKTIKEQNEQIMKLQQQIEKSYTQVQDIAVRAVESSSRKAQNIQQSINTDN